MDVGEPEEGLRKVRIDGEGVAECRSCRVEASQASECDAEEIVASRILIEEGQSIESGVRGRFEILASQKKPTESELEPRVIGIDLETLSQSDLSFVQTAESDEDSSAIGEVARADKIVSGDSIENLERLAPPVLRDKQL
jgi:hypothetical protein